MESIIQKDENGDPVRECFLCGTTKDLELHHMMHGTANRAIADKYGLTVYLCRKHHTGGKDAVHNNIDIDLAFQTLAQKTFEEKIGTRQRFIEEFGKSLL